MPSNDKVQVDSVKKLADVAHRYAAEGKYEDSITCYRQSAIFASRQDDLSSYVYNMTKISECYEKMHKYDEAFLKQEEMLDFLEKVSASSDLKAICLVNLMKFSGVFRVDYSEDEEDEEEDEGEEYEDDLLDLLSTKDLLREAYLEQFKALSTCLSADDSKLFMHSFESLIADLDSEGFYEVPHVLEDFLSLIQESRILFGKLVSQYELQDYLKERQEEFSFLYEEIKQNEDFFLSILDDSEEQPSRIQRAGGHLISLYGDNENVQKAEKTLLDVQERLEGIFNKDGLSKDLLRVLSDQYIESAFFYTENKKDIKMAKFYLKKFEKLTDLAKYEGLLAYSTEDLYEKKSVDVICELYNTMSYAFSGYLSLKKAQNKKMAKFLSDVIFILDSLDSL